ncbi:hypothetical protein [Labilibacter marinus]|uniref:hypothetical protein n=1 Tax=Labilibacter marinus TaxID=1477105 RepID=UPI00082AD9BD|nr:hypothetical protein [Labilibacter marinus]
MKRGRKSKVANLARKYWWILLPIALVMFVVGLKDGIKSFFEGENVGRYKAIANQVYKSMDTTFYGTNENMLFKSLEHLQGFELRSVYKEFGTKKYQGWGNGFGGSELDLFGWFNVELNEKEKTQMREIWVKSNISITF